MPEYKSPEIGSMLPCDIREIQGSFLKESISSQSKRYIWDSGALHAVVTVADGGEWGVGLTRSEPETQSLRRLLWVKGVKNFNEVEQELSNVEQRLNEKITEAQKEFETKLNHWRSILEDLKSFPVNELKEIMEK